MAAVTNHHKCLQTTEVYSLTTLEARSPKSVSLAQMKVSAELVLSGGIICSLPLPVSFGYWHSLAYGHITPISKASIFKSLYAISIFTFPYLCVCELSLTPSYKYPCDVIRAQLFYPG